MNLLQERLLEHRGHDVHICTYKTNDPQNDCVCLECWDCEAIIFDTDTYDLIGIDEEE